MTQTLPAHAHFTLEGNINNLSAKRHTLTHVLLQVDLHYELKNLDMYLQSFCKTNQLLHIIVSYHNY